LKTVTDLLENNSVSMLFIFLLGDPLVGHLVQNIGEHCTSHEHVDVSSWWGQDFDENVEIGSWVLVDESMVGGLHVSSESISESWEKCRTTTKHDILVQVGSACGISALDKG
jgi:hypothetical protein